MGFDILIVDGAVQQRSRWVELTKTTEARFGQSKNVLALRPGDKFFITGIEAKTEAKDDLLRISILSYDVLPISDGANQKRYAATLVFKMPKNSLQESAPDQVEQLVEAFLAPQPGDMAANSAAAMSVAPQKGQPAAQASPTSAASATSAAAAAAAELLPMGSLLRIATAASTAHTASQPAAQTSQPAAPAQPAQAAAPPSPPAVRTISLGQSVPQVVAVLGQPQQIVDLGAKKTYIYPNLKVRFVNGKVSDVE